LLGGWYNFEMKAIALLLLASSVAAGNPLTVEAFKSLQVSFHRPEPALVQVKGHLLPGFTCPPCPPGAQCEPCAGDTLLLSDKSEPCGRKDCSHELEISRALLKAAFSPGMTATFEVKLAPAYLLTALETAEGKALKERNQETGKALRDSLKRNPKLVPKKRPDWLKEIPGDSYDLKN